MNRREILKSAAASSALAATGGAISSYSPPAPPGPPPSPVFVSINDARIATTALLAIHDLTRKPPRPDWIAMQEPYVFVYFRGVNYTYNFTALLVTKGDEAVALVAALEGTRDFVRAGEFLVRLGSVIGISAVYRNHDRRDTIDIWNDAGSRIQVFGEGVEALIPAFEEYHA